MIAANPRQSGLKYGIRGQELYAMQDATIFASYAQLAATYLGLASVWVGAFNEKEVKDILELPDEIRPVALLPIGYAAEEPDNRERKNLDEIIIKEI